MSYKTKEDKKKAKAKWDNLAIVLDPKGYERHKEKLAAFKSSGGGASKKALAAAEKKGRQSAQDSLLAKGYVMKDMSGSTLDDLLNYQPDFKGTVKFDEKMAEIRGVGASLKEELSKDNKIKKLSGFEQNKELVKLREKLGGKPEYDRGGRYLGGGEAPRQPDKYVTKGGKLKRIKGPEKRDDPYGQLAVQRTYDEYNSSVPKKTQKSYMKLTSKLGIGKKKAAKALK